MRQRIDRVAPLVREHMVKAQQAQQRHYNRAAQPREFQTGDRVMVLVPTAACKFLATFWAVSLRSWQTTRPSNGWLGPRTLTPGWRGGSSRSRIFASSSAIGPEPPTPTRTDSLGSGQRSQVCQGSLPTHPQSPPCCYLMFPPGPGQRLGGGGCDERPEHSSALPWRRTRITCTSSSRLDRPHLRLVCPRPDKPCEARKRGETYLL